MKSRLSWYRYKYVLRLMPTMFMNILILFFDIVCLANAYRYVVALVLGVVLFVMIIIMNIAMLLTISDNFLESSTKYRTRNAPKHKDYQKFVIDKYKNKNQ